MLSVGTAQPCPPVLTSECRTPPGSSLLLAPSVLVLPPLSAGSLCRANPNIAGPGVRTQVGTRMSQVQIVKIGK